MKTTLNKILEYSPEFDEWDRLLRGLNKTQGDDEPLEFRRILEINGLYGALWCLRTVDGIKDSIAIFVLFCNNQCSKLGIAHEEFDLSDDSISLSDIAYDAHIDALMGIEFSVDENLFHNSASYDRARFALSDIARKEQEQKFMELFCK